MTKKKQIDWNNYNSIYDVVDRITNTIFKVQRTEGKFVLTERDVLDAKVTIKKSGNIIVLCFDNSKDTKDTKIDISPIFDNPNGVKAITDYVVFYNDEDTLYVFIIELKSNNCDNALSQIRASYELCKYICGTASRLLNKKVEDYKIVYFGLIFTKNSKFKPSSTTKNMQIKYDKKTSNLVYSYMSTNNLYSINTFIEPYNQFISKNNRQYK